MLKRGSLAVIFQCKETNNTPGLCMHVMEHIELLLAFIIMFIILRPSLACTAIWQSGAARLHLSFCDHDLCQENVENTFFVVQWLHLRGMHFNPVLRLPQQRPARPVSRISRPRCGWLLRILPLATGLHCLGRPKVHFPALLAEICCCCPGHLFQWARPKVTHVFFISHDFNAKGCRS
jgi:hypothetical protein